MAPHNLKPHYSIGTGLSKSSLSTLLDASNAVEDLYTKAGLSLRVGYLKSAIVPGSRGMVIPVSEDIQRAHSNAFV